MFRQTWRASRRGETLLVAIGEMIKMHILRPKPGTTAGGAGDASGPSAPTSASPIPDGRAPAPDRVPASVP